MEASLTKSQIFNAPRVMIAAPSSSSGKTTLTCALLTLLKSMGKKPLSYKCGPDYIDPLFHENVLGLPSTNLDSFFCGPDLLNSIFAENYIRAEGQCAVLEGVMGLFDGLGGKSLKASSYDIASITKTPVILEIDASGMSRSILPLIKGFLDYDRANSPSGQNLIKGIFLNKVSKSTFQLLKAMIEEETSLPVLGFLSKNSEYVWKSRHLGLFLPSEIKDLQSQIKKTAEDLKENLDFSLLTKIMEESQSLSINMDLSPQKSQSLGFNSPDSVKIAVAKDQAFCFYYEENLRLLEKLGASLIYFSPLHDKKLPEGIQGLLLGGGYPEIYACDLEKNSSMRSSIKEALEKGIPVMAECGGFMYLQESLTDQNGKTYQMCSCIKGRSTYTGRLVRFGYADFSLKKEKIPLIIKGPLPETEGFSIKGHEFHYFDSDNNGSDFTAKKELSSRSWEGVIFNEKMLAGFPHFYYPSNPKIAEWFVSSCKNK